MGQDESRLQSESSKKEFEASKRASIARSGSFSFGHQRSQSMVQSAPVRSPTPGPPAYSVQDPSPTRSTHGTNPFVNSPLSINTSGQPPRVPPVDPRRQVSALPQSLAPNPSSSSSRHRRAATVGQQAPQQSNVGYGAQRNQTAVLTRPVNHSNGRAPQPAPPPVPAPAPAPAPNRPARRASVQEDPLIQLMKYDTVIIVDDSSSMAGPLWYEAKEALAGVARLAAKYDADGLDICFLNSPETAQGVSAEDVNLLFERIEPDGITPTGEKLEILLLDYLLRLEQAKDEADAGHPAALQQIKPVNFLVITDGAPTDDPESVIVTAARRLDAGKFPINQVGIQFIQIGDDPSAAEALRELDDDLAKKYGIRDIVDTTPYTGRSLDATTLTKILLGGINRRVDRRGAV